MASLMQNLVRGVLREAGPLSAEEIVARLAAERPLPSDNPVQTVRNVMKNDPACQSTGDGRHVYLPAFLRGASMRLPLDLAAAATGLPAVYPEAAAFLWPAGWTQGLPALTVALEGGPAVAAGSRQGGGVVETRVVLELPAAFRRWWEERRRAGHDALSLRCEDGEAGRFAASSLRSADLDRQAVAARNERLREAATAVLERSRGLSADILARRLLSRGVYHGEPSPDPLAAVLFEPGARFYLEGGNVTWRAEMTPALRRLLEPRRGTERRQQEGMLRWLPGLQPSLEPEPEPPSTGDPALGYRIKVGLQRNKRVWRVIEIGSDQTLEDLHLAIQDAFGWDNDHLYSFFLSGRAWDSKTEISAPFDDADPPTADEVTLAELGLTPGQRFLYLFDYGDELRHQVEVLDTFSPPPGGGLPRIAESHGRAPEQYPDWDEDS